MRNLRPEDVKALKVLEGEILYVYDDSVYPTRMFKRGDKVGGTLTAGVGHTGSEITNWIGKHIPTSVVDKWLDEDTLLCRSWVDSLGVNLNPNQYAALVFWSFNVGVGAARKSTLAKKLKAGDYDSVPAELRKWTKTRVNGKMITSNGLIKRRSDEISYWLADPKQGTPQPVPRPDNKPAGTQLATPETPKTLSIENVASGVSIVSGALSSFTTGPVAYAMAGVLVVAAVVALYYFVTKRLFPK